MARIIQSLPFKYVIEFQDGGGILYLIKGKTACFLWIMSETLQIVYALNMWTSFFDGCFFDEILDPPRIAMDFIFSFFFVIVLMHQLTLILKMSQLVVFFNSIFPVHWNYFGKSQNSKGESPTDNVKKFTEFFCNFVMFQKKFLGRVKPALENMKIFLSL